MSVNTFEPSYVADSTLDGITPIQQFEPVLNTPAATSFIIISIVFTLLQLRINAVSSAAKRRSTALEELRKIESLQLSEPDGIEDQVNKAKLEYENAREEQEQEQPLNCSQQDEGWIVHTNRKQRTRNQAALPKDAGKGKGT